MLGLGWVELSWYSRPELNRDQRFRKPNTAKVRIPMKADTHSDPYRTAFRAKRTEAGAKRRSGLVLQNCPISIKV